MIAPRSSFSMPKPLKNRAFVLMPEMITGLAIVALLAGVLCVAMVSERKMDHRAGQQLQTLRLAEATLTAMQLGKPKPTQADAKIEVRDLGSHWAQVDVTIGSEHTKLIGPTTRPGGMP